MRQMGHITDTKHAFSATTSVPSVPSPDTIFAHAVVLCKPVQIQATRCNATGISYENRKSHCLRAKDIALDIALEVTQRCKRLVLEHHKWHRMRISEARNVSSHPRPPAKRQGTRERARACPGPGPRVRVIHGALTMPYATIERPWNYDTQLDTPKWPMLTFVALHPRPAMLRV